MLAIRMQHFIRCCCLESGSINPLDATLPFFIQLKWSGKFGQSAKTYPIQTNGYENDKATEFFKQIKSCSGAQGAAR